MMTEIKKIILLLCVSLIASEWVQHFDENEAYCTQSIVGCHNDCALFSCLTEIHCYVFACWASKSEDKLTNDDMNETEKYNKNKNTSHPDFIETAVRTTNWFPHYKWKFSKNLCMMNQIIRYQHDSFPYQLDTTDIFISDLKYYIYTLGEIIV